MIHADHQWMAEQLFRVYINRSVKKHFYSVEINASRLTLNNEFPVVLLPNHNTWWDGFFAYLTSRDIFNLPIYLMMTEEQLQNYPFFSRVGAYSINLKQKKQMLSSLKYTTDLLNTGKRKLVCVFPQGELKPYNPAAISYKRGIRWIGEKLQRKINIIPLAIRIEFLDQQRPQVFLLPGKNIIADAASFPDTAHLEAVHQDLLYTLENDIRSGTQYTPLLEGKNSVHESYSKIARSIGWKS